MKLMFTLMRQRPDMDVMAACLAIDIVAQFITDDPVVINAEAWIQKRGLQETTQKFASKVKALEQIAFIRSSKDGMDYTITKGAHFKQLMQGQTFQITTDQPKEKKQGDPPILERKYAFRKSVMAFKEEYPEKMLEAFYEYWSEAKAGKMRFELQFFDVKRRLVTWKKNQEKFAERQNNW